MDKYKSDVTIFDSVLIVVLVFASILAGFFVGVSSTKRSMESALLETNIKNGSVIRTNDIYGREFYLNSK